MKRPIHIFGAGGLGREVRALLSRLAEWRVAGFFDDKVIPGALVDGLTCFGGIDQLLSGSEQMEIVVAIGDPATKQSIIGRLQGAQHLSFPTVIDPDARLLDPKQIHIGAGSIITAGSILTTGISVGRHCLVNLNVTIGHEARIGDCCSIMPGVNLAGSVHLGSGVLVGNGANLLNGIRVGDGARIGAGSVVLHDVAANTTVVGVPAKEKK